ncbi:MAG: arsenic resistance protein [Pseudomonadota bacterium]
MSVLSPAPETESAPGLGMTALLLGAIALGLLAGLSAPPIGAAASFAIDPTLLVLVGLLFFDLRLGAVTAAFGNLRFIALAWGANFLVVPVVGFALASLFLSGQPLVFTGLLIYFLAPCTDWFLAFTRLAKGDTALGAALLPINLVTQLLLFPVWLWIFTSHAGFVDFAAIPGVLLQWFLLPFGIAQAARWLASRGLDASTTGRLHSAVGAAIPLVTAALVFQLFSANATVVAAHVDAVPPAAAAIFLFFAAMFLVGEAATRVFGLSHGEQALLAMTTAARNAPMMLVITAVAIPGQPLVYAALVIGMLLELPHLLGLKHLLLAKLDR